jgi:hypothetical protein
LPRDSSPGACGGAGDGSVLRLGGMDDAQVVRALQRSARDLLTA